MLDNSHDVTLPQHIAEDWPSLDEIESLERQHGRKVDFDYESTREAGADETGSIEQGISSGQAGHPQSSPFSKRLDGGN